MSAKAPTKRVERLKAITCLWHKWPYWACSISAHSRFPTSMSQIKFHHTAFSVSAKAPKHIGNRLNKRSFTVSDFNEPNKISPHGIFSFGQSTKTHREQAERGISVYTHASYLSHRQNGLINICSARKHNIFSLHHHASCLASSSSYQSTSSIPLRQCTCCWSW